METKDLVRRALFLGGITFGMMGAGDLTPDSWKACAEGTKKTSAKHGSGGSCGADGCGEGECGEDGCGKKKKKKKHGKEGGCGADGCGAKKGKSGGCGENGCG